MKLKKIYLEITNACNLNCDFCIKNSRKITNITIDNIGIEINNTAVEILSEGEGIRPLNRDDFNSTNTTIPSSVESIGWGAFAGCENLEALNLKDIAACCKMQFDYDHISESYDHYFEDVDDDWIGYKEYNYSYFNFN